MRAITPLLASVFLFAPVLTSTVTAQATPVAETPPESCLAAFTFPVLPGEHPHDVAPAADGWLRSCHDHRDAARMMSPPRPTTGISGTRRSAPGPWVCSTQ